MAPETLEGTWEEVSRHAEQLAGKRVRVTVLSGSKPANQLATKVRNAATHDDWVREFRAWAASHPEDTPILSDGAISRESIYGARG